MIILKGDIQLAISFLIAICIGIFTFYELFI